MSWRRLFQNRPSCRSRCLGRCLRVSWPPYSLSSTCCSSSLAWSAARYRDLCTAWRSDSSWGPACLGARCRPCACMWGVRGDRDDSGAGRRCSQSSRRDDPRRPWQSYRPACGTCPGRGSWSPDATCIDSTPGTGRLMRCSCPLHPLVVFPRRRRAALHPHSSFLLTDSDEQQKWPGRIGHLNASTMLPETFLEAEGSLRCWTVWGVTSLGHDRWKVCPWLCHGPAWPMGFCRWTCSFPVFDVGHVRLQFCLWICPNLRIA